jgi:hypothetical protein
VPGAAASVAVATEEVAAEAVATATDGRVEAATEAAASEEVG